MKLLKVYLNAGIEEEFKSLIKSIGAKEYIKIPKAMGKLEGLDPMEDNHIWPGYFVIYELMVDKDKEKKLLKEIKDFSQRYKDEGVCVILNDIECIKGR